MKSLVFAVTLVLFIAQIDKIRSDSFCPDYDVIAPCTCEQRPKHEFFTNAIVTCRSVEDPRRTVSKFQHYDFRGMIILIFDTLQSKKVPRDVLCKTLVSSISFLRSPLENVDDNAFEGHDYLSTVIFSNTKLSTIPVTSLVRLKRLTSLEISYSELTEIRGNQLSRLVKLQDLSLAGNKLSVLLSNPFPPGLTQVNLQNNAFTEVPKFDYFPSGIFVLLGGNKIQHLNKDRIWPMVTTKSIVLYLGDNVEYNSCPLECGCNMKWIANYNNLHLKVDSGIYGICAGDNPRKTKQVSKLNFTDFDDCKIPVLIHAFKKLIKN